MKAFFTICLIISTNVAAFAQIGSLDTTFGSGGKVTTLVTFTSGANAIALQKDGKIVAAGYGYNGTKYEFAIARYDTDGTIDTTFGLEGIDTMRLRSGNSIATCIAIQPDGKIVLAGKSSNVNSNKPSDTTMRFAIARFDSTGLPDSTFGQNGFVTDSVGSTDDEAFGIVVQPNGKLLVGGSSFLARNNNFPDFALMRLQANGQPDSTFNHTGKLLTNVTAYTNEGYAVALQKNGKILLGGAASFSGNFNFTVVRYDSSGSIDNTFGSNQSGFASIDFNGKDIIYSIVINDSGKIVLGGTSSGTSSFFALAQLDTNGIIDSTFGINGKDTTHFFSKDDEIRSLSIDASNKIIAAGFAKNINLSPVQYEFALARYSANGVIDTTFGNNGKTITGFGMANAEALSTVLQTDGKILLAGYANNNPKQQFALARYNVTIDTVVTGIAAANDGNNSLLLYPDPCNNSAQLNYTLTIDESVTINIYDVMGRLVQAVLTNEKRAAGNYEQTLNLNALLPGFYILNLYNDKSLSLSVKLIKQ